MARLRTTFVGVVSSAMLVWSLMPAAVSAHSGAPPDISFWGGWGRIDPGTAQCQQVIGSAARRCFNSVFGIQRRCMDGQMSGRVCDPTTRDSQITAAEQAAQDQVAAVCTDTQLQLLRFINLNDAKSDVSRACNDQVDAAISLLYGPVIATGTVSAANQTTSGCIERTVALSAKLLTYLVQLKSRTLDRIAARDFTRDQKVAILAQVATRAASVQQRVTDLIQRSCPGFETTYARPMTSFADLLVPRGDCVVGAAYVQSAVTCPAPVCGNGVKESGEQCDDGNSIDGDLCHNNCTANNCAVFPSSYALIQSAIFEGHGCTNDLCHGASRSGNLDLRAGASYADTVGVPSFINQAMSRIQKGDEEHSLLWLKLAAATLKTPNVPGSPMPSGPFLPLSINELEAVQIWIHNDAPQTGIVTGVADRLNACVLPPQPIQIEAPPAPTPGTGVQLHMPRWDLEAHSEHEVCFASYYDVTNQVPPDFLGANGDTFRFHRQEIAQDPQSHHLIVNLYYGSATIDDPAWGPFTCKGGTLDGQPCDPKQMDSCASDGVCGSEPTSSVACIGFGPPDTQTNFAGFTGTQQPSYEQTFLGGVYEEIPLKGIIIWNSHAFNLTGEKAKQEAWLNLYFADAQKDQKYPVHGIFDISDIFGMIVPPFHTEQICNTYVLEQGARLFELSSHNHKRGKKFTIYLPDGSLEFTSTVYNDPIQLRLDPPLVFDDPEITKRTLTYCSLYDNGATDPSEVKKKSTSPPTPNDFPFGGPCAVPTGCTVGNVGKTCNGRNSQCDTSPGAGDGVCDACTLRGGVTTEDEMFILLGSYYVP